MAYKRSKKEEFIESRIKGITFEEISKSMSISRQTLITWSQTSLIKDAIKIGKQIRIQSILKEYQIDRESRLKRLSILSKSINDELENREYSNLPTDKLIKIAIITDARIIEMIKEETYYSIDSELIPFGNEGTFSFNPLD